MIMDFREVKFKSRLCCEDCVILYGKISTGMLSLLSKPRESISEGWLPYCLDFSAHLSFCASYILCILM